MKNIIKIGIIQQSNSASIETNRANLIHKIKQLANDGAELIVLQELHDSLYFCQSENISCFDIAYKIPGAETAEYASVARESGVVLVTSLFEKRAPGLYHNTAIVFDKDGSIAGKYRKRADTMRAADSGCAAKKCEAEKIRETPRREGATRQTPKRR